MRKSILWKGFHIRLFQAVGVALLCSLAIAGCGGGGGGGNNGNNGNNGGSGNNPPPNNTLAVISGKVVDISGNNVSGATVSIVGTSLAATSGSDGAFQINNVPLTETQFQVTRPNATYDQIGIYNSVQYNLGTDSTGCKLPLPALHAVSSGVIALPSEIQLYLSGNPPPPPVSPPPAGCPQ